MSERPPIHFIGDDKAMRSSSIRWQGRSGRHGVLPAKESGRETSAEFSERAFETKTRKGTFRVYIQDICDFCKEYRYVKRSFMNLRKYGYRFLCVQCKEKTGLALGKETKLILCFIHPPFPGKR